MRIELAFFLFLLPSLVSGTSAFITEWNTELVYETSLPFGTYPSSQITLGLLSTGTYNFVVDWGDGASDTITSWDQAETTHVYASEGVYTVTMEGEIDGWRFDIGEYTYDAVKLIGISQWGSLKLNDGGKWFEGCRNLDITAIDSPDVSAVRNARHGFQYCALTNTDFTAWDTSQFTSLYFTFYDNENFNGDISTWDVSSVTNFESTFDTSHTFNGLLGAWDTSAATTLKNMLDEVYDFNQDISGWDVSQVTQLSLGFSFLTLLGSWYLSYTYTYVCLHIYIYVFVGLYDRARLL